MDPQKAIEILQDGQVYGKDLTDKQRNFFANLAGTDLDGNPLEQTTDEEQEFKYGGNMKRIETPDDYSIMDQVAIMMKNGGNVKSLAKFIRSINIVKTGGETIRPSASTNEIVAQKQLEFKTYLQNNALSAMADEEAHNIVAAHEAYMKYGGSYFALGGQEDGEPYGPETPYEYALRMQKMQPIPQNNKVQITETETPVNYDFSMNTFGQSAPANPYQVQPTIMTGTPAPVVTPSTSQTMDALTSNPALDSTQNQQFQNQSQGSGKGVTISGPAMAESLISGMNMFSGIFEGTERRKREEEAKKRMNADAIFGVDPGDDRGSYDVNSGAFRPDDMVPIQFKGRNFGSFGSRTQYKEGGEYMLSDEEIEEIKRQGGTIDYID